MRKKTVFYCFFVGVFLVLSGCSQKEKDYSEVIDSALATNKELIEQYNWDSEYKGFKRESSHIMIWEDEYNYFVYFRKNLTDDIYGDRIYGDGYKIGKENNQGSSAPADRSEIVSFYEANISPIYEEVNVDLVSDTMRMR